MTSGEVTIEAACRQRATWKVPNFFHLQLDAQRSTTSPQMNFFGNCYCLRLYPYGRNYNLNTDTVCSITLEYCGRTVESTHTKRTSTVSFELRLKSRTGKEIYLNCDSDGLAFIQRRYLQENIYMCVPDNTLTIVCYISGGEPCIAGGPLPATNDRQQEGLPGVVKLQSDYRQLLQKEEDTDACLVVSGKEFRAHRNILRARSPVFHAMFGHETAEKESGRVVIEDLDPERFGDFLEYLYTGSVGAGLSNDNAFGLCTAADKYDVPTLKSECVAYMRRNLSVDCFCDVLTVALLHSVEDLQQQTTRFFKENVALIIVTPKWKQFVKDNGTIANELFIKAIVPGQQ